MPSDFEKISLTFSQTADVLGNFCGSGGAEKQWFSTFPLLKTIDGTLREFADANAFDVPCELKKGKSRGTFVDAHKIPIHDNDVNPYLLYLQYEAKTGRPKELFGSSFGFLTKFIFANKILLDEGWEISNIIEMKKRKKMHSKMQTKLPTHFLDVFRQMLVSGVPEVFYREFNV
jgi:hypothetical protein